jgi:hypothetical protein
VWKTGRIGRLLDNPAYAARMRLDGKVVVSSMSCGLCDGKLLFRRILAC